MSKGNSATIGKTVVLVLKSLPARNRDIISRRFGLKNGKKETLESIGSSYDITRERVRQIEEFTIGQLAKSSASGEVSSYVTWAKNALADNDGVLKEKDLFRSFSGADGQTVANASLSFVLSLSKDIARFPENDDFYAFWALGQDRLDAFKNSAVSLVSALDKSKKVVVDNELLNFARKSGASGYSSGELTQNQLSAVLSASKNVGKNIFNQVGLVSWSEIKPRGVRDKAYLVLKKESSPLHFGHIARKINDLGFQDKKANVQTVHNELIKDGRFVLVGRGMYALSEWGYAPGTVRDVLVSILKSSEKPLPKAALVAKVLNSRIVKENTILLNLQDSKTFLKKEDGTYTLRKA